MPLNKAALESEILQALKMNASEEDADKAVQKQAKAIADAIDTFVKSGTVITTVPGVMSGPSATTGTGNVT